MWQQLIQSLLKKGVLNEKDLPDFGAGTSSINGDLGTGYESGGWGNRIEQDNRGFQSDSVRGRDMPSDRARQQEPDNRDPDLALISGLANIQRPSGGQDFGKFGREGSGNQAQAQLNALRQRSRAGKQQQGMGGIDRGNTMMQQRAHLQRQQQPHAWQQPQTLMAPTPRAPMRGLIDSPDTIQSLLGKHGLELSKKKGRAPYELPWVPGRGGR